MFEAACAPKEQPEVPIENEGSLVPTHDPTETTPTAASQSRTPTVSSTSRTESQMGTASGSEDPSFQAFSQSDGQGGLMTSTPAPAHRTKNVPNKIFNNKDESLDPSTADESPHTRLRRQMDNLQLDDASLDMSDTTGSTAPISPSSSSTTSLSSFRPKSDQDKPGAKGKGRAQGPDLRAKALHNVALSAMQKAYGPVFTERSSIASSNLSMLSSADDSSMIKPKPSAIFNPAIAANNQAPSIFTRPFARAPAPSSTTLAQQQLMQNLLKEAEHDKRAGMPIGTKLPTRSPARFNALRHALDNANAISLSIDDDTVSTQAGGAENVNTDIYGNEVFGAAGGPLDDSYSDSDEDEDEEDEEIGGNVAHFPVIPEQYATQGGDSFDTSSWQADNRDGTTNVFAAGRAAPAGGVFQLADIYRGAEPDSFVAETPILSRRAESRHLG